MNTATVDGKYPVLNFYGPSGSGKSTTLLMLAYNAKKKKKNVLFISLMNDVLINVPESFSRDYFIFVDDAQNLRNRKDVVEFIDKTAEAACLAFSPVLVENHGSSTANCPIKATNFFNFTPFTEQEVMRYTKANKECVDQEILLPKYLSMHIPMGDIVRTICDFLHSTFKKFRVSYAELRDRDDGPTVNLINACSSDTLSEVQKAAALRSGLFYIRDDMVIPAYPKHLLLDELASHVKMMYTAMREFNLGMAVEFLFSVAIRRTIMTATCRGKKPRPVALSNGAKICDKTFTLQCDNYIVEQKIEDNLTVTGSGCHLVKLFERHPAIDFLVIDNSAGKSSRRLFLIQVSAVKYQKRGSNKKVNAVLEINDITNEQTPVDFYCTKTEVEKNMCFFVFASPEIPIDHNFTRDTEIANIVYFMKIMI